MLIALYVHIVLLFLPVFVRRLEFLKAAFQQFEADYYVKADDDIYLRPGILRCVL